MRRSAITGSPTQVSAGTALVAALTMLAIKLGSAAPMMLLRLDREHGPGTAQVLNDLGGATFVLSWLPFGVVLGLVGVPLSIVGMRDPVSASPVAFLLGLLWLAAVSTRLAVRSSAL